MVVLVLFPVWSLVSCRSWFEDEYKPTDQSEEGASRLIRTDQSEAGGTSRLIRAENLWADFQRLTTTEVCGPCWSQRGAGCS